MAEINVSASPAATNQSLLFLSSLFLPSFLSSLFLSLYPFLSLSLRRLAFFFSQNYFGDAWNVFDFVIVCGSFVDITYSEIHVSRGYSLPIFDSLSASYL